MVLFTTQTEARVTLAVFFLFMVTCENKSCDGNILFSTVECMLKLYFFKEYITHFLPCFNSTPVVQHSVCQKKKMKGFNFQLDYKKN